MSEKVLVSKASRKSRSIFMKNHCFSSKVVISMVGRGRGRRQTHKRINGLGGGGGGCLEGFGGFGGGVERERARGGFWGGGGGGVVGRGGGGGERRINRF